MSNPSTLLFNTNQLFYPFGVGGAEKFTIECLTYLKKKGYRIILIATTAQETLKTLNERR